jgi:hypothetical protein
MRECARYRRYQRRLTVPLAPLISAWRFQARAGHSPRFIREKKKRVSRVWVWDSFSTQRRARGRLPKSTMGSGPTRAKRGYAPVGRGSQDYCANDERRGVTRFTFLPPRRSCAWKLEAGAHAILILSQQLVAHDEVRCSEERTRSTVLPVAVAVAGAFQVVVIVSMNVAHPVGARDAVAKRPSSGPVTCP